jgi:hypothetical protein
MAKAIHGGRVMCAWNQKYDIEENISDFDAVSLYPSAMARLYCVEGMPEVIEDLSYESLKKIIQHLSLKLNLQRWVKITPSLSLFKSTKTKFGTTTLFKRHAEWSSTTFIWKT